jgi:hypothetical protein
MPTPPRPLLDTLLDAVECGAHPTAMKVFTPIATTQCREMMARPKLLFLKSPLPARKGRRAIASDYQVYATYRRTGSGTFMGDLKVVRMTDSRVLFPFDGAPAIGPFKVASDALEAARFRGAEIVAADLANPE